MKIDQLKKFLSNIAYKTITVEKKQELHQLTHKISAPVSSGVCGKKTSNLCLIIFPKSGIIDQYLPLLEIFASDPVTLTYVTEEPFMAKQFGIESEGAVVYKPKRSKFTKIDTAETEDVKKLVENVLSGGEAQWTKVENQYGNGLMFKEVVEKDEL